MISHTIKFLTAILILKVTVAVILGYRDYFPADFTSEFLMGRERYFWGSYSWAFYSHLFAGPSTLIIGLLLLHRKFRNRFPHMHRVLGRVQIGLILLLICPPGMIMSFGASAGPIATLGFLVLVILTGATAVAGWRNAVRRRFRTHELWMQRCYLLLCSAVVIRVWGGLGTVLEIEAPWWNQSAAWGSWLIPLLIFEIWRHFKSRTGIIPHPVSHPSTQREVLQPVNSSPES